MWHNKYIGIPYVDNGRTPEGVDCWGLTRLIYKNEYNIDLPSLVEEYVPKDTNHVSDLISQYREGWAKMSNPSEGDVVLFNILGHTSHIGVMINDKQFIHCARNISAAIESIESQKWARRVQGYYTYTSEAESTFKEVPIALAVAPLEVGVVEGFTVGDALDVLAKTKGLPRYIKKRILIYVDGVPHTGDLDRVINAGQRVEYRLVPDDSDTLKIVALVALVVFAAPFAASMGAWAGSLGAQALGLGVFGTNAMIFAGQIIGSYAAMTIGAGLINQIFPSRKPEAAHYGGDAGTSNPQLILNGSRNEARAFGSIPVVLGTYRVVAPMAANTYSVSETDTSYLKMLLCWGYGDADITDIRAGATLLSEYDDVKVYTSGNVTSSSTSELTSLFDIYGKDTAQIFPSVKLTYTEPSGSESDWVSRVLNSNVTSITVSLHFPQGLRGIYRTGNAAGSAFATAFKFKAQARQLDQNLNPVGPWVSAKYLGAGRSFTLANASAGQYRWHRVFIRYGVITLIEGPTFDNVGDTTTIVGRDYYGEGESSPIYGATLPALSVDMVALWDIQTHSSGETLDHVTVRKMIPPGYTGFDLTFGTPQDRKVTIDAGDTGDTDVEFVYGESGALYYLRKDAFTANVYFGNLTEAPYEVRLKRTNSDVTEPSGDSGPILMQDGYFSAITGFTNKAPVNVPIGCSLALTAINIKATDQLNGSVEGINALVTSKCLDFIPLAVKNVSNLTSTFSSNVANLTINGLLNVSSDIYVGSIITGHAGIADGTIITSITYTFNYISAVSFTSSLVLTLNTPAASSATSGATITTTNIWAKKSTSNPASLFRYILQHPANAQRVLEAEVADKLDLATLQEWHTYCATNSFTYNGVITDQRSLMDVLRDVAAAGRASPLLVNGKWTVVIDKPRTTIVQQFTPHNSWDFSGSKSLPTVPHALRVNYVNAAREYQAEELIVYNDAIRFIYVTVANNGDSTCEVVSTDADNISVGSKVLASTLIPAGTTVTAVSGTTVTLSTGVGVLAGAETVKFNTKYMVSNATLFEALSFPGTTTGELAYKHARFHLAQSRLRSEMYNLNVDMEYLVCNRGDLVRVVHDIPMWGTSSGRIDYSEPSGSNTIIHLDEPVTLATGISYVVRIRTPSGGNITRNITAVGATAEYTSIVVNPALTGTEGDSGNLYLIGVNTQDSTELVVLGVEPSSNMTAKLTLVDYAPAVYTSDTELIPDVSSNITRPSIFTRNFITQIPSIVQADIRSDESVMLLSGASFIYRMRVPFSVQSDINPNITSIEARACLTLDTSPSWRTGKLVPLSAGNIVIEDVIEGEQYDIQVRYVSNSGFTGPWSPVVTHTIVGKTTVPSDVANFSASLQSYSGKVLLTWDANGEIDVVEYEVRTTNANWGTDTNYIYRGKVTELLVNPSSAGTAVTFYIKAIDAARLYSTNAASAGINVTAPNQVTNILVSYSDTSLTTSEATIIWDAAIVTSFQVRNYTVTITRPDSSVSTTIVDATYLKVAADWVGTLNISIVTNDIVGNSSTAASASSNKLVPNSVASSTTVATGSTIELTWNAPVQTTLPISGYEIRRIDTNWGTPTGLTWRGSVLKFSATDFTLGGVNTWYIRAFDTDNNYSSTSHTMSHTTVLPSAVTNVQTTYSDTSLTTSEATISWDVAIPGSFSVKNYVVTLTRPGNLVSTATVDATYIKVPANWVGNLSISIVTKDIVGNNSAAATASSTKDIPADIVSATVSVNGTVLDITWAAPAATTLPIGGYEIRKVNANWGSLTGLLWKGDALKFSATDHVLGNNTWFIKAFDTDGNYSATCYTAAYEVLAPVSTAFNDPEFSDTSLTTAEVKLSWSSVSPIFGLKEYKLMYDAEVVLVKSTTLVVPANWVGDKTFSIQVIDNLGNISAVTQLPVTKLLPNPVPTASFKAQIVDNNVLLFWSYPNKTTLPISHARIKKGNSWASGTTMGDVSGTFSAIFETLAGTYTYWIAVVDTDNNESTPISLTVYVSQPPDFIFNAAYTSTFTGTKSNAVSYGVTGVVLPVNTSEIWSDHFSTRSWATPQAQVDAGYPIYAQPTVASGYYEEVFDYGNILASSQVTLSYTGTIVAGAPVLVTTISLSANGTDYIDYASTPIFGTNFRYVKVRITVSQVSTTTALYHLQSLNLRLDSKQKTDSGTTSMNSADANGTIINFNSEFIDVASITLTPLGTSQLSAVYDFRDTVISGTYSATGTECTLSETSHGLIIGQKVRLYFSSGTAINGVYTVSSVTNANEYKVSMNVISPTSGSHQGYPNSCRGYLFDGAGARQSGTLSWNVRGY